MGVGPRRSWRYRTVIVIGPVSIELVITGDNICVNAIVNRSSEPICITLDDIVLPPDADPRAQEILLKRKQQDHLY